MEIIIVTLLVLLLVAVVFLNTRKKEGNTHSQELLVQLNSELRKEIQEVRKELSQDAEKSRVEIDQKLTGINKEINDFHKTSKSDEKFNKEKALKCINNCNFDKLKKLEDEKGFSEAVTKKGSDEKIKFFNLGKDNDYRKLLNENLINKMNNLFQEELVKYKYE